MRETFMKRQEAERLNSSVCLLPAPRCLWRAFKPKMSWYCRAGKKAGKMEPSCLLLATSNGSSFCRFSLQRMGAHSQVWLERRSEAY